MSGTPQLILLEFSKSIFIDLFTRHAQQVYVGSMAYLTGLLHKQDDTIVGQYSLLRHVSTYFDSTNIYIPLCKRRKREM